MTKENDPILPLALHGAEFSYFTGKLEGMIRYMELPYQRRPAGPTSDAASATGVAQVPALQLADGRWLTDSTPIVAWLDERFPEVAVTPSDPKLAFFSRLLEDYADEWLWRPAMHFRWSYPESAKNVARSLISDEGTLAPILQFVMRHFIITRQQKLFVREDGVTPATWNHIEKIYHDSLAQLNAIFESRPYLLGSKPSLADFAFFGPMFRHFSQDPTSARIMRETAPAVLEWTSRMWNARASVTGGELLDHVPDDWGPILDSIGAAYLPSLCANAEAWKAGQSHHDVDIEGAPYRRIRTSRYRVWCLEELRRHFNELSEPDQQEVRARLDAHGCWAPLWRVEDPASGLDPKHEVPFAGGHSMTGIDARDAEPLIWRMVAAVHQALGNTKT